MPDLTSALLPDIRACRLPDLDLGPGAVHPNYSGRSILNLPSTLDRWLGLTPGPHTPLAIPGLDDLAAGARQVVVCLLDALSLSRFTAWLDGPGRTLQPLVADGLLAPLTSVVPSTTTAALTTLWTGRSPAEHGILGYELLLREYGLVVNMITLAPAAFDNHRGLLERAGVRPRSMLPLPTLGSRLAQAGVEAHAFIGNAIRGSGLSRMHYADVELHGFGSPADLWHGVRLLVERPAQGRRFVWAYYSGVDALSHVYGPDSDRVQVEYEFFARALVDLFVHPLDRNAARDVILLLLADHGQV
ncbi:MAG: alkaline phosphatase family protein, partial [Anaerolineales bacterium]|nr:alkaline phosphatase family protein [Anaerolineales bacterium]